MSFVLQPWHLLLGILSGWVNRQQQEEIEYCRTTIQVLVEKLGSKPSPSCRATSAEISASPQSDPSRFQDFHRRSSILTTRHYEAELNRALGEPKDRRMDSTTRRIKSAGDALLEGLLFAREAPLTSPIAGSTKYTELFARSGPRDRQGRSLRDFDLKTRMFRYPCSYLIYSAAFDYLPDTVKTHVATRLHDVLTGRDTDKAFSHLAADDRQAILEILTETKPELWNTMLLSP